MLIKEKLQELSTYETTGRTIDRLVLEWYETNKRILHKRTTSGKEITIKFLQENQNLTQGDVLYEDAKTIIAVEIAACDVIVVKPKSMYETAAVCYEIGNKHLPLFYENDEVLVAYEAPLLRLLKTAGYDVAEGKRKLLNPLKTTVTPHGSSSLFSKIMNLTASPKASPNPSEGGA
jgi:urease accessory protein